MLFKKEGFAMIAFFVAFLLVFLSELGDKTQLLVLSFSSKVKSVWILLGVCLGSFLSHGIAILFGSSIGLLENDIFHFYLELFTYFSFLLFGIFSLFSSFEVGNSKKGNLLQKLASLNLGYVFMIAASIAIGEFGDKTFLASIGLGISYPHEKIFLFAGAILGMVVSDSIAILLGKFLSRKVSEATMQKISSLLFILFGIVGLIFLFFYC